MNNETFDETMPIDRQVGMDPCQRFSITMTNKAGEYLESPLYLLKRDTLQTWSCVAISSSGDDLQNSSNVPIDIEGRPYFNLLNCFDFFVGLYAYWPGHNASWEEDMKLSQGWVQLRLLMVYLARKNSYFATSCTLYFMAWWALWLRYLA